MKVSTVLAAASLAGSAMAIDAIEIKGTKFFFKNGTQFFMKGIAYQQDTAAAGGETTTGKYKDPLADEAACRRDVPILAAAGTNTIRTYAIDPSANHDACMRLLSNAGIYVISDLSEPVLSINRDTPGWNVDLFKRYQAVVDTLAKYDNTLGFFAGNEVSNNRSNTGASAYVKAAVRDTKAYIKSKGYRPMGVGYAANDDADIRVEIANYFNCGSPEESIDFWGYNIYSWCGQSSYTQSGYDKQVEFFRPYSVPVFFAEYGCNTVGGAEGRTFDEVEALYGPDMTPVFSGGIVYMYFQEANDYGLVKLNGNSASTMKNYDALKSQVAKAAPSSVQANAYTPTNTPASCPAISSNWEAAAALPPTPNQQLCECMYSTLQCVPSSNLATDNYGDIFGFICGTNGNPCSGINGNTKSGVYGAYHGCDDTQKLGYALDSYFKIQKANSACDFQGQAQLIKAPGAAQSCSALLASASAANSVAATATSAPTATGSGKNAAGMAAPMTRFFSMGEMAVGAYLVVALAAGAGMVLL